MSRPVFTRLLLLIPFVAVALIAPGTSVVLVAAEERARTTDGVNLREKPSTSSEVLMVIPAGTTVAVTGEEEKGFFPVSYADTEGWVSSDHLEFVETPVVTPDPGPTAPPTGEAVAVESLNLREGPGQEYLSIKMIEAGEVVQVFDEISGRYQKVSHEGVVGWARSVYLDRPPSAEPQQAGSPVAAAVESILPGATATLAAEVTFRAGPDLTAEKIGVVPLGSSVTLAGPRTNGFAEVEFDGETGWVAEGYLTLDPEFLPEGPSEVPILLYHSIQEVPGEYQVVAWQLDEQLGWLAGNGYTSITSADLLAWLTRGTPLPDKPVMITIDDGYATDWFFLQLLEKYQMQGVFFLPNYADMTDQQVRTLSRAGEVCGHTVTHPALSSLDYGGQWEEIYGNKVMLEEILGKPVTCFAYPFGDYNHVTDYVMIDSGFLIGYNAWGGPAPLDGSLNRWHVTRINISGAYTLSDFIAVI
jgi:uncharacterized protein YraI/peptidoglycan/xylan/chitin deacetylase (PgdA/CDA1 family)